MDRSKSIREETVEKRLKRLCDERGWLCLKLDPSTKKGIPDRMIVASYGLLYFVELKRPKGAEGPQGKGPRRLRGQHQGERGRPRRQD